MLDSAARLLLSPLLVAQALGVRRRAQSLPEARGPRNGRQGTGPRLRLGIIGDSSAAGVGVASQDQALSGQLVELLARDFEVDWFLLATTGATTKSTVRRLSGVTGRSMDLIITALGVNDVTRLIPAQRWVSQQQQLFALIETIFEPRQIYVSGMAPIGAFPLLPQPLRWTLGRHAQKLEAARITALSGQPGLTHMPFNMPLDPALMATDGFHPSAQLYHLWAKDLASRIRADWPYSVT